MRGWVVFLWALLATIVLIAVGIFGSLVVSGRITLFPEPTPTPTPTPVVTPVVDFSYEVLVMNATPESGLATRTRDLIITAGWPADLVTAGEAGVTDFAETTIYYVFPEDEAAAAGLAGVIGGATLTQSDFYQVEDDPATTDVDESAAKQLTVVLGMDRVQAPAPTPTG